MKIYDLKKGDVFTVKYEIVTVSENGGGALVKTGPLENQVFARGDREVHELLERSPQIGDLYRPVSSLWCRYEYRGDFDGQKVWLRHDTKTLHFLKAFPQSYVKVPN